MGMSLYLYSKSDCENCSNMSKRKGGVSYLPEHLGTTCTDPPRSSSGGREGCLTFLNMLDRQATLDRSSRFDGGGWEGEGCLTFLNILDRQATLDRSSRFDGGGWEGEGCLTFLNILDRQATLDRSSRSSGGGWEGRGVLPS